MLDDCYGADPRLRSLSFENNEDGSNPTGGGLERRIAPVSRRERDVITAVPDLLPGSREGSVRCTHHSCLIRWISERGSWSCELRYFKYQVLAISTKNPKQLQAISLTVIERVQIDSIILGSLYLIASISWLVWSSVSPSAKWQGRIFSSRYATACLLIHEGSSVYWIFKRWQAVNQQWKLLNYEKAKDLYDPVGLSSQRHIERNSTDTVTGS